MTIIELALVTLVVALLLVATVSDARHRIIPDWVSIAIALAAPLYWWVTSVPIWPGLAVQLAVVTGAFLIGYAAFAVGQMGGGDVKLMLALALFLPPWTAFIAFCCLTLVGGLMTAGLYVDHLWRRRETPFENPYGIAIAIGASLALADHYGWFAIGPLLNALMMPATIVCVAALAWRIVARLRAKPTANPTIS